MEIAIYALWNGHTQFPGTKVPAHGQLGIGLDQRQLQQLNGSTLPGEATVRVAGGARSPVTTDEEDEGHDNDHQTREGEGRLGEGGDEAGGGGPGRGGHALVLGLLLQLYLPGGARGRVG